MAARILIVDDQAGLRMLLKEVLELEGHQVETAKNGQECLEKVRESNFTLLIVDLVLPGVGGEKLLKEINAHHSTENIIAISGDESQIKPENLSKWGIYNYLEKPFDLWVFKQTVNETLQRS